MNDPYERGLPYTLIKIAFVEACPRLMIAVSKTGNSSHGVDRIETALQACKRIHSIIAEQKKDRASCKKDVIHKLACMSEVPGYGETVACIHDFVVAYSGGSEAPEVQFLTDLETYESFLSVKKKLKAFNLAKFAIVSMPVAPNWIPMMAKAKLNAPGTMVSNGFADVFSSADISSVGRNGKNLANAIEGAKQAVAAKELLVAYSSLNAIAITKLVSDFEVRIVMHVHGKAA